MLKIATHENYRRSRSKIQTRTLRDLRERQSQLFVPVFGLASLELLVLEPLPVVKTIHFRTVDWMNMYSTVHTQNVYRHMNL